MSFFSGINTFCNVLNNGLVMNTIKTLNKRNKADTIMTFHF